MAPLYSESARHYDQDATKILDALATIYEAQQPLVIHRRPGLCTSVWGARPTDQNRFCLPARSVSGEEQPFFKDCSSIRCILKIGKLISAFVENENMFDQALVIESANINEIANGRVCNQQGGGRIAQ